MISIKGNRCIILLSILFVYALICAQPAFAAYTLTLTSSGAQSIDVSASAGTAISADNINISTTCRYGYNFTINTSVNDNNLYLNGNSSNNVEGSYFSPVDGTSALNTTTNKWGYYYNNSIIPTNTSVFLPVPTLSNPSTVKTPLVTPSSSNINDNFNIYYGVSVSSTMSQGTYKMIPDVNNSNSDGTIVYTATIADDCLRYIVHFSPTSIFEGNTISGTGTMADQIIYENVTTPLTNNSYTAPSGYYFTGWNTAQDGTGTYYTNQQSVTDLITTGSTITLYAQWTDCPPNTICYSPNVANPNDVEGEMGNQSISNTDTSTVLYAPNFKRTNYGFAAWNTHPNGIGINYGPNQTLSLETNQYQNFGLKLYAKWVANTDNMQNWTNCNNMNIGDVTALKDTRDNNVYAVAKLADGKCWMIESLRLANKDANNNDINLTSANTHDPSLPLTNSDSTTSNHLSPTTNPTQTAWCTSNSNACDNKSMLTTNNTTTFINNTSSSYNAGGDIYNFGNYYNWYSATAGHGKYGNNYGSSYYAPGDICPLGWHLPRGGNKTQESTNELWQLVVTGINNGVNPANYNSSSTPYYTGTPEGTNVSNALRSYPNNYVFSGYVNGSSIQHRNSRAGYWSASGSSTNQAYGMDFDANGVAPGTYSDNKYYGRAVRCVAGT